MFIIVGLGLFVLWIYFVLDVITTPETDVRNMPKLVWLLLVVFLPLVGSIAWLLVGRPHGPLFRAIEGLGSPSQAPRPRPRSHPSGRRAAPRGPDDSPEFLAGLDKRADDLKSWEDDLKRREDDLRRQQDEE